MRKPALRVALFVASFVFGFTVIGPVISGQSPFTLRKSPQPTPTHVAALFADGFTSGDFRQVCSTMARPAALAKMSDCEGWAASVGVTKVTVVPHSAKVWTEDYQGRSVELATVAVKVVVYEPNFDTFTYEPKTYDFVLHLRRTKAGWRIWNIEIAKGQV